MLQPDDPTSLAYEPVLRTALLNGRLCDGTLGLREKDQRRLHQTSDKHILELVQLALREDSLATDKHGRVLELCGMFYADKGYEMVGQLLRHHRMAALGERVEMLRKDFARKQERRDELGAVETPRLPARIQLASPSLVLANLTPTEATLRATASEADSTAGPDSQAEASPSGTRLTMKRARMELVADSTDVMADVVSVSNDAADMNDDPVDLCSHQQPILPELPQQKKPRGLAEMLSRLSSASLDPVAPKTSADHSKKAATAFKENVAGVQHVQKGLKQASLASKFAKKTPASAVVPTAPVEGEVIAKEDTHVIHE